MKFLSILFLLQFYMMNSQTQIIAHRGFWQTQPPTSENSLKALENAQNLKAYGSEFDVRMSKDGKLVVHHDEKMNELEISETPFWELKKMKLSNGEKLPSLKKYLKQGKKFPETRLIVELKPANTKALEDEIVQKTLDLIKNLNLESQCEFISFSKNICLEIKKISPKSTVQYLEGDISPADLKNMGIDGLDYHYSVFLEKHPNWVAEAKSLGMVTNTWTVNDLEIFKKLKEMGVQFVTTNIPDVLIKQ